jgi:5S rRNA maturation endonuclease (ribonuclease M5)
LSIFILSFPALIFLDASGGTDGGIFRFLSLLHNNQYSEERGIFLRRINGDKLRDCIKSLEGKLVIVEGMKDSRALKTLGVKNIMQLNGKPLAEFALHVSNSYVSPIDTEWKEAVILTDFDSEGRSIAARLECLLKVRRVPVNSRIRKRFMGFGWTRIEEFREDDIHGKTSANFDKVRGKG